MHTCSKGAYIYIQCVLLGLNATNREETPIENSMFAQFHGGSFIKPFE